jgi:hypothetical protein
VFRHCVMMKFTDDATPEQREAVRVGIAALPDQIEQIRSYTVGFNAGDRPDNYDLAAVGDFDSKADYDIYAAHPDHVALIQNVIAPVVAGRSAVQYEF